MRHLRLVFAALWLVVLLIAVPLLGFGLERTHAIFGGWHDWQEHWQRDMWTLIIGLAVLFTALTVGVILATAGRRRVAATTFGLALAAALTVAGLAFVGHPERFRDLRDQITDYPKPTTPAQRAAMQPFLSLPTT